jgi:hypothetical protein
MIPEAIVLRLKEYCRKNGGVRIDIHHENNPHALCGLFFDTDGLSKTLTTRIDLIVYISNHLKYSKHPIMIKIDGKDLKDIVPIALPILPPEQINIDLK